MLPLTIELSRSTAPATSNHSSRASRWRKIVSSSTRARRMRPCRSARRSRTRGAGSGAGRSGTRTDPRRPPRLGSPTRSTARADHPPRSWCRAPHSPRVAVRVKWLIGVTQRRISSTASGIRSGVARQLLPLGPVLAEREQAPADRVAGRLVPGFDQELAVRDELLVGERRLRRSRPGSARSPGRPADRCGAGRSGAGSRRAPHRAPA